LAREFLLLIQESKRTNKIPFLILIIDKEPPVKVKRLGKLEIYDAISKKLEIVLSKSGNKKSDTTLYRNRIKDIICWITWEQIKSIVDKQLKIFEFETDSIYNTVKRLCESIIYSIEIHSFKNQSL
jgi:hypothetical protein